MKSFYRILCTLTISALISGSALVAQSQQDDQDENQPPAADQQYDNRAPVDQDNQAPVDQKDQQYNRDDNQTAPNDQQAAPRQDQRDDQSPNDQRYGQNSDDQRYDQNQPYDRDQDQAAQPDRVAPNQRYEQQGPREEDLPLETPQYDARNGPLQNNAEAATPDPRAGPHVCNSRPDRFRFNLRELATG